MPGIYTPLVVMLTATLVLGVASLALDSTVNTRAEMMAQQEIGADVRLEYAQVEPGWETLPGVSEQRRRDAAGRLRADHAAGDRSGQHVSRRCKKPPNSSPDSRLSCRAGCCRTIRQRFRFRLKHPPKMTKVTITTQLDLQLLDGRGVPFTVPLSPAEPGVASRL